MVHPVTMGHTKILCKVSKKLWNEGVKAELLPGELCLGDKIIKTKAIVNFYQEKKNIALDCYFSPNVLEEGMKNFDFFHYRLSKGRILLRSKFLSEII